MAYRDTWATCRQCGKQFLFRLEEQRRMEQQGHEVAPPERCQDCGRTTASLAERPPAPRIAPRPRPERPQTGVSLGHGPHEGKVKWFSAEKGYGFIVHPGGQEVFFHHSGIAPGASLDFPDGAWVTFLVEETEKGPQAVDVERKDSPHG